MIPPSTARSRSRAGRPWDGAAWVAAGAGWHPRPHRERVARPWWVSSWPRIIPDHPSRCETTSYVKVAGRWRYVYRAIDQAGQVIDVLVSQQRNGRAARRFFERAIGTTKVVAVEIVTDRAPTYPVVLEELLPAAWHRTDRYANNRVEADHGRAEGAATTDARAQAGPQYHDRDRRARLRPEPTARALRTRCRGTGEPTGCGRVRRARLGDLTPGDLTPDRCSATACRRPTRRNSAVAAICWRRA
jgi:DDE domain